MTEAILGIVLLLCTGFDLWFSNRQWKKGIPDLNPVVQHFVKTGGPTIGLLSLGAINLLVMGAAFLYLPCVWMLVGAKATLASFQLRSLTNG